MKKSFKTLLALFLAFTLIILSVPASVFSVTTVWDGSIADSFESGTGTWGDPYIIKTAEQLAYLASSVNNGNSYAGEYIRLDADIQLNDTTNWESWGTANEQGNVIAPVNSWTPIGIDDEHAFRGAFLGNDHIITGIYVYGEYQYAGLFGYQDTYSGISGLGVEKSLIYNLKPDGNPYTGAILGRGYHSHISDCHNSGNVRSKYDAVGGIVGYGTVYNSYNEGKVSGYNEVGGIAGCGKVYSSYNIGNISGCYSVGGVVGYSGEYSAILNCYNTGMVTGESDGEYTSDIGGVVGNVGSNSTVANCYNTGSVTANSTEYDNTGYTGGVIGYAVDSTVTECYNTGAITFNNTGNGSTGKTGGIAGGTSGCSVSRCYNTAEVIGGKGNYSSVAGAIGSVSGSKITLCYNTGAVSGGSDYMGGAFGVVGEEATVSDCYNTGSVKVSNYHNEYVGGAVGYVKGTVKNCYNIGIVTDERVNDFSDCKIGGFAGSGTQGAVISDCYYLSGCATEENDYATSKTNEQLQDCAFFENWNFNKTWEIGFSTEYMYPTLRCFGSKEYYYRVRFFDGDNCVLEQLVLCDEYVEISALEDKEELDFLCWKSGRDNSTYVYSESEYNYYWPSDDIDFRAMWTTRNINEHTWDKSIDTDWEGDGTESNPYLISSAAELAGLAQEVNSGSSYSGKYFLQTTNIVLNDGGDRFCETISGKNYWTPIGNRSYRLFSGYYNGDGNTVSGVYVRGYYDYAGLFGSGNISNLGIINSFVFNNGYDYSGTGGVVGTGKAVNCYNTADVVGGKGSFTYTGGVIGSGEATGCYNTGAVTGTYDDDEKTGGVVGYGIASNCYNTGDVIGDDYTGGISGYWSATDCYNTGNVIGNGYYTGGILGSGTSENCYNTGSIIGNGYYTGGILGDGTSNNCYNTGDVTGKEDAGGVAGSASKKVCNSFNTGKVTGNRYAGGVIGTLSGTVDNCYNSGAVAGYGENYLYIGGVVGSVGKNASLSNSYNTATVNAYNSVYSLTGGVAGSVTGTLTNCYNIGSVTSISGKDIRIGGLTGSKTGEGEINNCYYISGCVENENSYGKSLTKEQMKDKKSFENWNFLKNWELIFDNEYPYPTLRCFGSKEYFYRVRFFDGETCLSDDLVRVGESIFFSKLTDKDTLDFGYWRSDETRYYSGDAFVPTDDIDFKAIWTTRNTSDNVWDGSVDTDWEGEGTKESPYLISSAAELAGLAQQVNSRFGNSNEEYSKQKYFKQTVDIVLNDAGNRFSDDIAGKNDWIPIGDGDYSFLGNYDGDGHTVSGMYIRGSYDYVGLFGLVYSGDTGISNLGVIDSYVYDIGAVTGGIAGVVYGVSVYDENDGDFHEYGGIVSNCYNTGAVTGKYVGGVVHRGVMVINCYNTGAVTGSETIGGVVGSVDDGEVVVNCRNAGTIVSESSTSSSSYTGGVIGHANGIYNNNSKISNCSNIGPIISGSYYTGGVVGYASDSTVTDCYNTGAVTGKRSSGGIVGFLWDATVSNCYNTGTIKSDYNYSSFTGGIAGRINDGTINECYNTGTVISSGGYNSYNYSYVGGIAGHFNYGTINESYNTGTVKCDDDYRFRYIYAGGLAGYNDYGTIYNCYNTGAVTNINGYAGGVVGSLNEGTVKNCYNIGTVSNHNSCGIVWRLEGDGTVDNCYFLNGCASRENGYGTVLTDEQMKTADSFVGFDFEGCWDIGVARGYDYPTLKNAKHIIYFNITFLDRDGTVLKKQAVEIGGSAEPPALEGYGDDSYYYILDHWDGSYNNVTEDRTVTAVYKQVEIIKFNDVSVPFTVEYGFSNEELRVQLESYFSRKLCTTTNGYKMMCEVVWNENNLSAYNPQQAGEYTINGTLKITDPAYSQFADYYNMAEGASVKVTVTVLPKDEQVIQLENSDLKYDILEDGKSVTLTGYSGNASEVVIPETMDGYSVVSISENAFAGNQTITAITIPSSIKIVGNNAFGGCSALVQAMFEDGVEEIGENAFYNTDLVSVTLPDSIETIGAKAFGYYGNDSLIEGFAIYCSADSAAKQYADENGINCGLLQEKTDEETGISVVAEENVTLVVAQIEEGSYYDNAQQIVQENDNISLFEIKIVDEQLNEAQPSNTLKISVPVPEGFNAETCEVYRINTDGTFKAMKAKLIDGMLVFMTSHLSYYAIIEGAVDEKHIGGTPVKENELLPDCENPGGYDEVVYCSVCGEEISREWITAKANGHSFFEKVDDEYLKSPADCSHAAVYYMSCSVCQKASDETFEYGTSRGHSFTNNVADKYLKTSADCTHKAVYYKSCSVCGEKSNETFESGTVLGHDLVHHDAKAPTCTAKGWDAYDTCSRCDYTTYNERPALGHDLIHHDAKAPTCTAKGWEAYDTCSRCDYTTYNERSALGHDYKAVITNPTCTEKGYTTHTCSRCKDSYVDTYVDALGHTEVIDKAVPPTCTATGLTEGKHCSVCNAVLVAQNKVAALGHDLIHHDAKAPTCTAKGWDAFDTCSRCDYTTYNELKATGHTPATAVTENIHAATCTVNGSYDEVVYCSTCRAELSREGKTILSTGHNYSSAWSSDTTNHWHKCTVCGDKSDIAKHSFVNGKCSVCGYIAIKVSFPDVNLKDWYGDAVSYAVSAGLMKGYASGKFGTADGIQRQDFVVILSRLSGDDLGKYSGQKAFKDVDPNAYYATALAWAKDKGVSSGYANGKFGVGDKVTREQIMVFLYNYAKLKGYDTTATMTEAQAKATYADFGKVSGYAKEAALWALSKGVVSGKDEGNGKKLIAPQANALRCEVAGMFYNIDQKGIFA